MQHPKGRPGPAGRRYALLPRLPAKLQSAGLRGPRPRPFRALCPPATPILFRVSGANLWHQTQDARPRLTAGRVLTSQHLPEEATRAKARRQPNLPFAQRCLQAVNNAVPAHA